MANLNSSDLKLVRSFTTNIYVRMLVQLLPLLQVYLQIDGLMLY